jgi:Rod binding domain-containing protein
MAALTVLPAIGQAPAAMPVAPKLPADPDKLMKAARDFEAMALGELIQPMFDTVDTSKGPFGGGAGEESWKPMMVAEMAKQIEAHGGLGLAKPIYEAMLQMQEAQTTGGLKR